MKRNITIRDELKQSFPKYSTRAMRREFMQCFGRVTHAKPAFLRQMYKRLTGDCSASTNLSEKDVDEHVSSLLECEDPDIVLDLRVNNHGQPKKYEVFLEECKKYIDGFIQTAVDDRRHDQVDKDFDVIIHLAVAMNVGDLYNEVKKRRPEGTQIPSIQWL